MIKLVQIRLKSLLYQIKKTFNGKRKGLSSILVPLMALSILGLEAVLLSTFTIMTGLLDSAFPWLYFSLIGVMAFGLGIFGTVFTTQNQMYEAKDNDLLLSMPIKPRAIILSRILVLFLITIFFVALVLIPASIAYFQHSGFQFSIFLILLVGIFVMSLLTQAITCFLGWLLHFTLSGFRHKAIVASVFMTGVMVLYFFAMSKFELLIYTIVENGEKIANAMQSFVWPFFIYGKACIGDMKYVLLFSAFGAGVFILVFRLLSSTFTKAMMNEGKKKGAVAKQWDGKTRSAAVAICRKEAKFFFSSTTYLINLGMGILMVLVLAIAGVLMKEKILNTVAEMKLDRGYLLFLIPIIFGVLSGMTAISAPSVSLEGKYFWILRTMPIDGASVLKAKLMFHCVASLPTAIISAFILTITFHFSFLEILLSVLMVGVIYVFCGIMGLIFNMCFPRLDWPNEAAPCKQSMSLLFTMFFMFIVGTAGGAFGFLFAKSFPSSFRIVVFFFLFCLYVLLCGLSYLLMAKWGGKKYEEL